MDNNDFAVDKFYRELREARQELDAYRALPSNKRNLIKLQELREKYEALEEIERQCF